MPTPNKPNKPSGTFLNLRLPVFCALGLFFGILFYLHIRFGRLSVGDFFLPAISLLALFPFSWKRTLCFVCSFLLFFGVGAGLIHFKCQRYLSGAEAGEYTVTGTVSSCTEGTGYCAVILKDVSLDGHRTSGKLRAYLSSEEVRTGDKLSFHASVKRLEIGIDGYEASYLSRDIRYTASASDAEKTGSSRDPFLLLDRTIGERLHADMEKDEADVSYALLLGHAEGIDEGLAEGMRQGGITHIFAVSGLHIGILFSAVQLLCRRLKRYSFLPALFLSLFYCALCGFSVSALRAIIMCTVLGAYAALGKKGDFPNAVGIAAVAVLLFFPAESVCAGFQLSFGACVGLALFSGSLSRAMKKLPRFLSGYLSASLSVQLVTFPILLSSFGYVSVWGLLLNLVLIPLLPVLFLTLLLCTLFALIIPPAGGFFLFFPEALISPLVSLFTAADFSAVITGFSLATGGALWMAACVLLSERVRMTPVLRAAAAIFFSVLFLCVICVRNLPVVDCTLISYHRNDADALLIRTREGNVLMIDDDITLSDCEDFLARNYYGRLDAVILVTENDARAANVAAFLNADEVRTMEELDMGFQEREFVHGDKFSHNGVEFRYLQPWKIMVTFNSFAFEVDYEHNEILFTNHFFGGGENAVYYVWMGGIYRGTV